MKLTDCILSEAMALNFAGSEAPDWVHLIPQDGSIKGVDGRAWTMSDAPAVITTFENRGIKLPIDIEHATQVKGSQGEEAPAVGWITELEARNTGLWGKVEWNARGTELVTSKSYGYLSPVFSFAKATGAVTRMVSAGLTNNPNLDLVALNRANPLKESEAMDKDVLEALGLNTDATSADAVTAIGKLKTAEATALNRAENPDSTKFVPRADYDLALNRVSTFEDAEKSRQSADVTATVEAAIAAGKIAPASRDYHIAACKADDGLKNFKAMVDASPEIAANTALDDKKPGTTTKTDLTAEEIATCSALGMSREDFAAQKAADAEEAST
jgi:phage I-like protein